MAASQPLLPHVVGRYALYGEIAAGGMATVHYGRLLGPVGFSRTVAVKRLHPQFAKDPEFVSMFLDEARLAARIRHPNVVPTLDVVALAGELFLVMDYVQGESLGRLVNACRGARQDVPLPVVTAILGGALHGLHAAHEAKSERGEPLHIVHRDVSPQNILVGVDGVPRVLDFGVAKAAGRAHTTRDGQVKGKLAYMAPETLLGRRIDRRADIYAAGVVLWETLTLQRLFTGDSEGAVVGAVLNTKIDPPSAVTGSVPSALDAVTMRALDRDPDKRFESAREMALALEGCVPVASASRVTEWVQSLAGEILAQRAQALAHIESDSGNPATPMTPAAGTAAAVDGEATLAANVDALVASPLGRDRRWRLAIVAGLASVALLVAVGLTTLRRPGASRSSPAAPTAETPLATVTTPPADSPTALATAEPSATPLPVVAEPSPARSRPRSSARPPPAASAAGPSAKPCAIRSYVDESGITHFVKECP